MSARSCLCLTVLVLALTLFINRDFLRYERTLVADCHLPGMSREQEQNLDVCGIYGGYRKTPSPFFSEWWHGPWIHQNEQVHGAFRPLSSMLLWAETNLALRYGYTANGWVGFGLFCLATFASASIAWQFTRSALAVWTSALLCPFLLFVNAKNPAEFLWWYPAHPELISITFILAVIGMADGFVETGKKRCLLGSAGMLTLAILVKEYALITVLVLPPLLAWRWQRTNEGRVVAAKRALCAEVLCLLTATALFLYRAAVIPHPYTPHLKGLRHFSEKSLCFMGNVWYAYLIPGELWYPGTAVLIAGFAFASFWLWRNGHLTGPLRVLGCGLAFAAILTVYWQTTYGDAGAALAYTFDTNQTSRATDLLNMIGGCFVLWVAWQCRRRYPLLALLASIYASYLPMLPYIGWHYLIQPWFLRCISWGVVAQILWEHGFLPFYKTRFSGRLSIGPGPN